MPTDDDNDFAAGVFVVALRVAGAEGLSQETLMKIGRGLPGRGAAAFGRLLRERIVVPKPERSPRHGFEVRRFRLSDSRLDTTPPPTEVH